MSNNPPVNIEMEGPFPSYNDAGVTTGQHWHTHAGCRLTGDIREHGSGVIVAQVEPRVDEQDRWVRCSSPEDGRRKIEAEARRARKEHKFW